MHQSRVSLRVNFFTHNYHKKRACADPELFSRGWGCPRYILVCRGGGVRGLFTGGPPNVPHPSRSAHEGFIRRLIYFSFCVSSPMWDNQNTLRFEFKDFVEQQSYKPLCVTFIMHIANYYSYLCSSVQIIVLQLYHLYCEFNYF